MSVTVYADHPKDKAKTVFDVLEREWEYDGTWCMKKFNQACCKQLKNKRQSLRLFWKKGGCRRDLPGPEDLDSLRWSRLVGYWISPKMIETSTRMKSNCSKLVEPSKVGRGGYAAVTAHLVSFCN